ncbi:hypothetical protein PQR46_18695 [Paraburkholderia sediminicola]|uniref:hypothetical protein n=1 Tax=Paraburkholderia sediminicola TaxID=458836 RepID=UPI0038BCBCFC
MREGWQAPLAVLVIVILFAAFNAKPIASAADIAAWVQGVGSLLAIIAAIWIYAKQYTDKKADDENETRAFVQAIRDEVNAVWNDYDAVIRQALLETEEGKPYVEITPPLNDTMVIYRANPGRLGKVDDDELRKRIVAVYVSLTGVFNGFALNSQAISELRRLAAHYQGPDNDKLIGGWEQGLATFAHNLKKHDEELKGNVDAMLAAVDFWLANHPPR